MKQIHSRSDLNKIYFIVLWFSLSLGSCSGAGPGDILITGAFGFSFGEQPAGFGETYLSDLKRIEVTHPPSPDERFDNFYYTVTPLTHKIYHLDAETNPDLTGLACTSLLDDLAAELIQKYYNKDEAFVSNIKNKWELKRNTKRSVSLQCMAVPGSLPTQDEQLYKLSISYLDYGLATEAYKEWKKGSRQAR